MLLSNPYPKEDTLKVFCVYISFRSLSRRGRTCRMVPDWRQGSHGSCFYSNEDTLKVLCCYLHCKCVMNRGSRMGVLWAHWEFLTIHMKNRVIHYVLYVLDRPQVTTWHFLGIFFISIWVKADVTLTLNITWDRQTLEKGINYVPESPSVLDKQKTGPDTWIIRCKL